MNNSAPDTRTDDVLEELVNEICDKMQTGEPVDIRKIAADHPEISEQLCRLYSTLLAVSSLDESVSSKSHQPVTGDGQNNEVLGDFRILRQIGRGGMGVVYEAQQLSINRRVALKVLPLAALVDHRALQRFKNEVTAIATLEHPHIVSVYAVGEERGIHYYAMQLIRGQSLAAVIRELRTRADQNDLLSGEAINKAISDIDKQEEKKGSGPFCAQHPQGRSGKKVLTPFSTEPDDADTETVARGRSNTARASGDPAYFRNVARLVRQAAEAIQHAHDHGIVHRDIKPGNLLLDTHGTLFVTDFGLARIETGAGVTMTGDMLGTLRYMSPEQVLGNRVVVDHRTDVYSLGVTLYELLTLQPIWQGDDKASLIRQISFEEPTRPQKINPSIPIDLETIVLKALSKNPNERYVSAQAFGDDLQAFLDHRSISAKRPTTAQRINKWTRRHPTLVAATLVTLLIVSVGSVISMAMIMDANDRTRQALTQSEKNLDHVIDAVEKLLWRVGETQLEHVPGTEQLRRELLNDAMEICNSLIDSENEDPRAKLRSIEALSSLGTIQADLGDDESAGKTLTLAISQFEDWLRQHPNHPSVAQAKQSMAGTCNNVGGHYLDLAKYEQASEMFHRGLELEKEVRATAQQVDSASNQLLRAVAYGNYSKALNGLNKDRAACEASEQASEILEQLVGHEPENATYQVYLGYAYSRLASSHDTLRQWNLAARNFERAVTILRKWSDQSSNKIWSKSVLAGTCSRYALLLTNDDQDKAKALIEESESVFSDLHRQFPDYPDYQSSLANCYKQLGELNSLLGKHRESIEVLEKSLPLRRKLVQSFPDRPDYRSDLATTLLSYVAVLDLVNDKQASEEAHAESIQIFEQLVEEHPEIPDYRFSLVREYYTTGLVLDQQGQPARADQVLEKAASISVRLLTDFPDILKYRAQLSNIHAARGTSLLTLGRSEVALEQIETAVVLMRQVLERDPENSSYQDNLLNLQITQAATQCSLGKFDDALQIFLDALPQYENRIKQAPGNPLNKSNYSGLLANIALTYRELGQHAFTARYMEQSLDVDDELLVVYPNPFVRHAIAEKTAVLLEVYSQIDEPAKLAALLGSASGDVEEFLDKLNSNELLFKKLIDISILIGKFGSRDQSQSLLEKCLQTGHRDFGSEHELTLTAANHLGLAQMKLADWKSARETFEQIIDILTNIHRDRPKDAMYTLMLGGAYCNLGNAKSQLNFDAIESYTSAIELLESLDEQKEDRSQFLKNSYQGRADAHRRAGLFSESLADFNRAVDLAADEPGKSELQLKRLKTQAQQGDYGQAVKLADAIFTELDNDQLAYDAAGVFAIAAQMVQVDDSLAAEVRQQNLTTYRDRAFELLEVAKRTNRFKNAESKETFLSDPDFSSIKADDRFNELISELDQTETQK